MSGWYGHCQECQKMAVLAHRPGTRKKICVRCMWPEDVAPNPQPRVESLRQPQKIKTAGAGRKKPRAPKRNAGQMEL